MAKFEELKLEKGLYHEAQKEGMTFTEFLETLDPSEEYKGSKLNGLDAFERQLMKLKLEVGGAMLAGEFFRTTESKVLYPEFINRNVRLGMGRGKFQATLADIAATTTPVTSGKYEAIEFDLDNSDVDYKRTAEGAFFSKVIGKTKEKAINLYKIGTELEASYEVLRRASVNVLAVTLQVLGMKLERKAVSEAISVIINGDGHSNSAGDVGIASSGTLTYSDMLNLELEADEGFEFNVLIGAKATMKKPMNLAEFKDALIAADWLSKGTPQTFFGNRLRINSGVPADVLLTLDQKAALELLEEKGGSLVESDKIIDQQLEKTVISTVKGFNKLFTGASKLLDISP